MEINKEEKMRFVTKLIFFVIILGMLPIMAFGQWNFIFDPSEDCGFDFFGFGVDSLATDFYDPSYDSVLPPTMPCPVKLYFPTNDTVWPTLLLKTSIKYPRDTVNWDFRLVSDGGIDSIQLCTLYWNSADLPIDYGSLYIDTLDDFSTANDMSRITSFSYVVNVKPYAVTTHVYFKFISDTTITDDTLPPYTINHVPACDDTTVPKDIDSIAFDIVDRGISGVNYSTVLITLNGLNLTAFFANSPILNGFHLCLEDPSPYLRDSTDYNLIIRASDWAGNDMNYNCFFHTSPPVGTSHKILGNVFDTTTFTALEGAVVSLPLGLITEYDTTDATGHYEFDDILDGLYNLTCDKDDYFSKTSPVTVVGLDTRLDFFLMPLDTSTTDTICGNVSDATTGMFLPNVNIYASWATDSTDTISDSLGTFCLPDIPKGIKVIFIAHASFGFYKDDTIIAMIDTLGDLNFSLEQITVFDVSGLIYLDGRTDYSGTIVELKTVGIDTTDSSGAFLFTSVDTGTYDLIFNHDGYIPETLNIVVSFGPVFRSDTLYKEPSYPPPRNLVGTDSFCAELVYLYWDCPLPDDIVEIVYDNGPLPGFYYLVDIELYSADRIGALFSVSDSNEIIAVKLGMYGDVDVNCEINLWSGSEPILPALGVQVATDYLHPDLFWVEFDFRSSPISVTGDFFVQIYPEASATEFYILADSLGDPTYDHFIFGRGLPPFPTWVNPVDFDPDASGIVWVLRVYIRDPDGTFMWIEPTVIRDETNVSSKFCNKTNPFESTRFSRMRNAIPLSTSKKGLYKTSEITESTEFTDLIKYRIYRSNSIFTDIHDPGVALIDSTVPDNTQYVDINVTSNTDYYYAVTAVYPGDIESDLSNIIRARTRDYVASGNILIIDHDWGEKLAGGDIDDEETVLAELIDSITTLPISDLVITEQDELFLNMRFVDDLGFKLYDAIFWITHFSPETYNGIEKLMDYLDAGGNLYIEGNDVGYFLDLNYEDFLETLGVAYLDDGLPMSSGNVAFVKTTDSTFWEWSPFAMDYHYKTIADAWINELDALSSAELLLYSWGDTLLTTDSTGRMIYFDSGTYKTITSSIYLGSLIDGVYPSQRKKIMGCILKAFGIENSYINNNIPKPEQPMLISARPNPFNASTEINFTIPKNNTVSLDIIDINGHKIKRLMKGTLSAGTYTYIWDGNTESGKTVSSGVYFARLLTENNASAKVKIVLIR